MSPIRVRGTCNLLLSPLVSRSVCPRLHILLVVVCRSDCIRDNRFLPEKHNCGSQYPKQRVASPTSNPASAARLQLAQQQQQHQHHICMPTACPLHCDTAASCLLSVACAVPFPAV